MFKKLLPIVAVFLMTCASIAFAEKGGATRVENVLWAGGIKYSTVLTPASFKMAPSHTTDKLYVFDMSGLTGQSPVADSYPGKEDYNGGRWWVQEVIFTQDGLDAHDSGDGSINMEFTSGDMIQHHIGLGHITIMETATYFECPLLPSRP